jgi:hypothetical protein
MISLVASGDIDLRFEPQSDQTKDYYISSCCFSTKYAV